MNGRMARFDQLVSQQLQIVARKQPFDACGNISLVCYKPSRSSTGSAQMSFEKSSRFITTVLSRFL
jgi:hypothetical protein